MSELSPTSIGILAVAALLVVAGLARWWWTPARRHDRALRKALRRIGSDTLENRVIPDGLDGEIQIDLMALTSKGIVVLEVKRVEGTVFGAASVDQWTALTPRRRVAFDNPLELMHRRVIALKALLGEEVPVEGRVVLVGELTLGADLPDVVTTPATLTETYALAGAKPDTSAYQQAWAQLKQASTA